jgi:arylsulfatase A-like enzyme
VSLSRRRFVRQAASTALALPLALSKSARLMAQASPGASGAAPKRPNLLLLWTDQHRGDVMPYAGNEAVQAPNLRALGERSFCFHRAYCTQPVCTPSRGSILTGLWPHHHGATDNNIPLRADARTIVEHLPPEYVTGYFGKWHLGNEITPQHGFRHWRSIEDDYRKYYSDASTRKQTSTYHRFLVERGFPPDVNPEDGLPAIFSRTMAAGMAERFTKAHYLAGEAEAFLRERRRDGQPFVLSVNTLEPHPPTYGPLNESHDPASLPASEAFGRPMSSSASLHHRHRAENLRRNGYKNHPIETQADWRRLRANYYGLVKMVDNAYGRILRALEESGQADNTIVVYTSDHGEMLGDHCLMGKGVFFEPSARIPMIIHVPWLSRQRVAFKGPFSQIDLVPTLLDLMGAAPVASVDGRSRASALRQPDTWRDEDVVVIWNESDDEREDGRCLIGADGWKLILYRGDGPELYDLNRDPAELRNLGGESAQKDRISRMGDRIRAWQQGHGDTLPLAMPA